MGDSVRAFYDELADHYHLIVADWPASMRRQAGVLDALFHAELGEGPHSILDAACGIGTQAIGRALRGHRVRATDLSPAAVARAEREAERFGAALTFGVGDLRDLAAAVPGEFDVVLACDNALPHLLIDAELDLASIRDYDQLARDRPRTEGPRVFDDPDGCRIDFQVWEWTEDGSAYRLRQFIVREAGRAWRTDHFSTDYRALFRADLSAALRRAGLADIRWHAPEASGYYQPIVTARKA